MDARLLADGLERMAERYGDVAITLVHNPEAGEGERWSGMATFGKEAEDSPMAGGASFAPQSGRAEEALEYVLRECGVLRSI